MTQEHMETVSLSITVQNTPEGEEAWVVALDDAMLAVLDKIARANGLIGDQARSRLFALSILLADYEHTISTRAVN